MASVDVVQGDCLEVLRALDDESVDAVVCDPPYGLSAPPDIAVVLRHWLAGTTYEHDAKGFMGKKWDAFVPGPAVWREAFRVLKPGGHLVAFASTRTVDLMGIAIRLGGFEIRDTLDWVYGSGFPKSLDVSKAIDKAAGAKRTVVTGTRHRNVKPFDDANGWNPNGTTGDHAYTAPATPEAAQWEGWGTTLKPAHEPLICARKNLTAVPEWHTVTASITLTLEHLCQLATAPCAEPPSTSNLLDSRVALFATAPALAKVVSTPNSGAWFVAMGMCKSLEEASTLWSIVSSWHSTLDVLSCPPSMYITATVNATTTALKILNSWTSQITRENMPLDPILPSGQAARAPGAAESSPADSWKSQHTLLPSAPESAGSNTMIETLRALALVVELLSVLHSPTTAASVRQPAPTATTTSNDVPEKSWSASNALASLRQALAASLSTADARVWPPTTGGAQHEPIILARKPLAGTVAQNVQKHGTGALNIDGCRVATAKGDEVALHGRAATENGWDARWANAQEPGQTAGQALGRWPPNFLLSHDPRCECVGTTVVRGDNRDADTLGGARPGGFGDVGADKGDGKPNGMVYGDEEVPVYRCVEGCPVAAMDAQSGMLKSGVMTGMQRGWGKHGIYGASGDTPATCYADSGGASRFFSILNWDPEYDVPFRYCAKPARKEREEGLVAEEEGKRANTHETVKPVKVMRWLLRLVVPPGGFFVDPFAGSGTTGVAAFLEGFNGLLIEKEATYVPIIEARLAHARTKAK